MIDIGIGGSMGKKEKEFNWAKYENGRDDEIKKLAVFLKSVIWQLSEPYKMKRVSRGRPYYPPKGMVLVAILMQGLRKRTGEKTSKSCT